MFEKIIEKIQDASTIIIHRHTKPDGDALGSQIGLYHLIRENYPNKKVYKVGDEAGRYSFMEGSVMDVITDELYKNALAIVLDTSAKHLISDTRYETAKDTARLDHHIFVERICEAEVTDTSYESCCGLITELAVEAGWRFSPLAAKSLYTGMVTDSGRFRYDSTGAKTHRLASKLMETPFDTNSIYLNLYQDDYKFIRLRALFVLKIQFAENGVAYIYTPKDEADSYGVDTFTISRGMVNTMGDIRGIHTWVNFTETDEGVLTEIRSNRYNINPIAVKYGGGGHQKASGACLKDHDEAMLMLKDLCDLEAN
ncbi:MAG: bifunctional oligoribonuclease/PAP phosphatase NrnA [Clostridia bacterium]|nr:bifunctional oligoribonuclease/PAP phosphatase NrnA [Clostridia bacterium]